MIDSLNGYLNAMPDERFLVLQMHELLSYLNQLGVLTIMVLAQHGLLGQMQTPIDLSYLSDAVIMLRYFEAARPGASSDLGCQETQRNTRKHNSRIPAHVGGHDSRPAAYRVQRHSNRNADVRRRDLKPLLPESGDDGHTEQVEQRVLVLAPIGRDALSSGTASRGKQS